VRSVYDYALYKFTFIIIIIIIKEPKLLSVDVFLRAQSVTNAFGGRAPTRGVERSPRLPSRKWGRGPTSKGKKGEGKGVGKGKELKGKGREGGEK